MDYIFTATDKSSDLVVDCGVISAAKAETIVGQNLIIARLAEIEGGTIIVETDGPFRYFFDRFER